MTKLEGPEEEATTTKGPEETPKKARAPVIEATYSKRNNKKETEKMDDNNVYGGGFGNLLAILGLTRGFGYGGHGGCGGYGPHAGGYGGHGPSIADEVAVQTLRQPTSADHAAQAAAQEARINGIQRDIGEIGRDLQTNLAGINRDLLLHGASAAAAAERQAAQTRADLAACCCETQKEIIQSRTENQVALCAMERALADKITEQENARLNRELGDCKAALATAAQTSQLGAMIGAAVQSGVGQVTAQCCCDPCSNGHGHGRGRGVAPTFVPPGQGGTPPGQQ